MKASKKFIVENELIMNPDTLQQQLSRLITEKGILEGLILEYEYGKGKLQHAHIIPDSFILNDETSGQFKAGYELNEFSLCAAIDYTAKDAMTIQFKIDQIGQEITLTGEQRNERFDEL